MTNDGYCKNSPLSISSRPSERESCKICNKFVYFHQPILVCTSCCKVFHGICLKISNDRVFILQQILWNCDDCCNAHDITRKFLCKSCSIEIDIQHESFNLCQHCRMPVHLTCLDDKLCAECRPTDSSSVDIDKHYDKQTSHADKFFDDLPIFNPFEFYEKSIIDFIPEAESLNESMQKCSIILNSCRYSKLESCSDLSQSNSSFIGLNIDGVRTNFDKFKIFDHKIRVTTKRKVLGYFLCETNVTASESEMFYLDGFNKFILDRKFNNKNKLKHKGSGLIIFLSQNLSKAKICEEMNISTNDFECLTIEVSNKDMKFLLICAYRSPSGDFDSFINVLDEVLSNANKRREYKSFLIGDLNVNLLNPSSQKCIRYLTCVFSNGFLPIISRATHFAGVNPTCIDHILCNELSEVSSSGIFKEKTSHHFPVFVEMDFEIECGRKLSNKPKLRINEFTLSNFCTDLEEIDKSLNFNNSAEICFSDFYNQFKLSYDKWFIAQTLNTKSKKFVTLRKEWITIGLAKSCDIRTELYEVWTESRTKANWNDYLNYSKRLDPMIDKVKFDFFCKRLDENKHDLKKTWSLMNSIMGRKRQNRLLTFPEEDAAHNFNKYFISVADNLVKKSYSDTIPDNSFMTHLCKSKGYEGNDFNPLENCTFEPYEINKLISELNNSKSTYFSPRILKSVSLKLSHVLSKLFNKCVSDGYFPSQLKIAKIIPLFKNKGNVSDMCNYRPISMLSVFSKLFEKLIHRVIVDFLETNELLNESQYGFRKKRSTLHALLNATENIYQACDTKLHTLGIFVDFSRAFDTVNHAILLKKLSYYGIKGQFLELLTSYLSGRTQYVSYGGRESTLLNILSGVPQGSVLGPLLFIIFVNDIVNITNVAKFVLFADDLNLFVIHTCRESLYKIANQILQELFKYCFSNRLILNYDKCCYMEFGTRSESQQKNDYFLGIYNNRFAQVERCKFLGVIINDQLNWDDQIKHVIMQVSKSCGTLYRVRLQVPRKILKLIYMALVQPYLNYCISLWGYSTTSSSMKSLFILQKKCIRIVTGKTSKENGMFKHTKPLFQSLNILTVFNLYVYFTASELMKILNSNSPKPLYDFFKISAHSERCIYPKFNLEFYKSKSFVFNGSKILNYLLQQDIPYSGISNPVFKSRLKRHLITMQSQSVARDDAWLPCNHNIFSDINF